MGSSRKDLLRECLIEWNLEFAILFPFIPHLLLVICCAISVQLSMFLQNESIEFVRLEETETPSVTEIEGEVGMEW